MPPPDPTPSFKPRARPAHTKRHRVARSLHDDSSSQSASDASDDDERTHSRRPKVQAITTYGDSDSEHDDRHKHARPNHHHHHRDDEKSRRRHGQPSHDRSPDQTVKAEPDEPEKPPVKWGLTINMKGAGSKPKTTNTPPPNLSPKPPPTSKRPLTLDDEALSSLLDSTSNPPKRSKPTSPNKDDEPDLDDYRALPIDDFGAHLLRGFGWDGQLKGKVKEVDRRRANLTGLGAKGDVKGAEDLGAWDQKGGGGGGGGGKPVRLEDYRREEGKRRERRDARERDSYKREREREREKGRR